MFQMAEDALAVLFHAVEMVAETVAGQEPEERSVAAREAAREEVGVVEVVERIWQGMVDQGRRRKSSTPKWKTTGVRKRRVVKLLPPMRQLTPMTVVTSI